MTELGRRWRYWLCRDGSPTRSGRAKARWLLRARAREDVNESVCAFSACRQVSSGRGTSRGTKGREGTSVRTSSRILTRHRVTPRKSGHTTDARPARVNKLVLHRVVAAGPVSRILSTGFLRQDGHSSGPHIAARLKRPTRRFDAPSRHVLGRSRGPSLFGLAPCGVCPARCITAAAVRSYRTFSPLPRCRGGMFSVALSVG
jgi:hypothetical protein